MIRDVGLDRLDLQNFGVEEPRHPPPEDANPAEHRSISPLSLEYITTPPISISFCLARCASQPTPARDLAHVLDPARVEQIWEMHYERLLLPNDFGQ